MNVIFQLLIFLSITLFITDFNSFVAYSDEINPGVYSITSTPYGKSYGEWASQWWDWFSAIPIQINPGTDTNGTNCAIGQPNKDMWFLTLTFGTANQVSRTCTIPSGRSVFVPVFANDCDGSEPKQPPLTTREQFLQCAKQQTDSNSFILSVTIDGKALKSVEKYRVDSPLFNMKYPNNNVYNVTSGVYPGVVDGFFVILQPLAAGKHELHISATALNPIKLLSSGYGHDIIYHLTIK